MCMCLLHGSWLAFGLLTPASPFGGGHLEHHIEEGIENQNIKKCENRNNF